MFGAATVRTPQRIAFLLVPEFSMMAFTSAIEPLRLANRQSERELYSWITLSVDGGTVDASNGVTVRPYQSLHDAFSVDVLFVCAGLHAERFQNASELARLCELARSGVALGGLCTGALPLARAGLLEGYRCTIHWENMEAFVERYPQLDVTATLYEVDRDRYTCAGGTAPVDMMVNSISKDHGEDLAVSVAEQMVHTFVRDAGQGQRMSIRHRTGISHPKVLAAIGYMEAYLENPLTLAELARSVELSPRQLERLFRDHCGRKPSRYYLELRLQRARSLLRQTAMPVVQVAVASGFSSASHFARCYRELFHRSPREERTAAERIP